jgi:multiple sugar transport system substrate-binding protein
MNKKSIFLFAICLILTISLFAGCGGGGDTTTKPAETTSGDGGETTADGGSNSEATVTLDLWHYFGEHEQTVFDAMIEKYNAENDKGIEVVATFVAREDLMKQYTMGAVSGELPDIGMVDNPDHASFTTMGVFEDITDLVNDWGQADQFFEGPMKSATLDGKIYGLPHNSNCLALIYNKTMLADAGVEVPETWDDLMVAAEKLTQGDTYGLSISAVKNEEGTFQFMPWFISAGGSIDDLSSPECVNALSFLTEMIDKGYMSKDVINWTQADANSQFIGGKAAMQINGPWNIANIQNDAPDLDFGVALVPKDQVHASVLGGENFGICAGAPLEESFDVLSFILNAENVADYCEAGGKFPPRADSMELKDIWQNDPIFSVFAEGMQYAMPRGPHPRWPEISDAISTAMHESFTGTKTAEQALADAKVKVDEIMK